MAIVPWRRREERSLTERGTDPFSYLRSQINRVFDDFWGDSGLAPQREMAAGFWPQMDVTETDKEIKVSAEIPGVEPKDIDVSVEDGMLTINGEKNTSAKRRRKGSIEWSAAMAHLSAPSNCLPKWTNRKLKPSSRKVCYD